MARWFVPLELRNLFQSNHVGLKHKALPFTLYIFIHYFTGKVLILIFFVIDPDVFFCLVIGPAYPIPFLLPGCVPNVAEVYDPMKTLPLAERETKIFRGLRAVSKICGKLH